VPSARDIGKLLQYSCLTNTWFANQHNQCATARLYFLEMSREPRNLGRSAYKRRTMQRCESIGAFVEHLASI
jgi:hypothetical protein